MSSTINAAAYKFLRLSQLRELRSELREITSQLQLKGTILLSEEGINLFIAGSRTAIDQFFQHLRQRIDVADMPVKFSPSSDQPFTRMLIRIKREIIAFGQPGIDPIGNPTPRLAPAELKKWLDAGKEVVLLDVRNNYEIEVGSFAGAIPIDVDHFRKFPQAVDKLPEELKQKTVVTFCTGGIRCEKAGPCLQQLGFADVYQLDGGILRYFDDVGQDHFEGRCFVFDKRVAVEPDLTQANLALCFACQAVLGAADQQSPEYRPGESCPHCYIDPAAAQKKSLADRQARLNEVVQPLPGSIPYENRRPLNVSRRFHGMRLLEFLAAVHPQVAQERWSESIDAGRIVRQDQSLGRNDIVREGDRLEHVIPQTVEPDVDANISILHEDDAIIVVNKPAPLPLHPSGRFHRNTLTYLLDQVYRPLFPRPQHRLDANTTGVVVLAKSRRWANALRFQFENRTVSKRYLCLVHGHPADEAFECDAAISVEPAAEGRRRIDPAGLPSTTYFRVLRRFENGTSLLMASPLSGRTNQIRLHLAHLSHPIVGDRNYGQRPGESAGAPHTLAVGESPMCLHHWEICFIHPASNDHVSFIADPPEWFRQLEMTAGELSRLALTTGELAHR